MHIYQYKHINIQHLVAQIGSWKNPCQPPNPLIFCTGIMCSEGIVAVEAFGEGVIDREADGGRGVGLGLLLHSLEIAALPARRQWQKKSRPKAAALTIIGKLAESFADRRQVAGVRAVGEGLQVTAGEASCRDDDMGQAPVKRQECPLYGFGGRLLVLLLYCHRFSLKKASSRGAGD